MEQNKFKKLLKEAVREVFNEEIKEIILEALKSNKDVIKENYSSTEKIIKPTKEINENFRKKMLNNILGTENEEIKFSSEQVMPSQYNPPIINTIGEGTALPPGEVNLNQIMQFIK